MTILVVQGFYGIKMSFATSNFPVWLVGKEGGGENLQ